MTAKQKQALRSKKIEGNIIGTHLPESDSEYLVPSSAEPYFYWNSSSRQLLNFAK